MLNVYFLAQTSSKLNLVNVYTIALTYFSFTTTNRFQKCQRFRASILLFNFRSLSYALNRSRARRSLRRGNVGNNASLPNESSARNVGRRFPSNKFFPNYSDIIQSGDHSSNSDQFDFSSGKLINSVYFP